MYVFIDEIYLDFLEGEERETSYSLSENFIVASSLTKVYGLGGLRCGWVIAPPPIARKLRVMNDYLIVEGVFMSEQISTKVIPLLDSLLEKNRPLINQNKSMIREFIHEDRWLSWVEPEGGVICFPRVEARMSGDRLASILRAKNDTSVVPGSYFGDAQHFRLGFGVSPAILARGLENIKKALSEP